MSTGSPLDVAAVRADFPFLNRDADGQPLAYLDNAATSQKPRQVIEALVDFYQNHCANVHRAVYSLSEEATFAYEDARAKVGALINAADSHEVVFTRNTTEAINLVARGWGGINLKPGDRIAVTGMEHHSNYLPWDMIARETGAFLSIVSVTQDGALDVDSLQQSLAQKPRLLAFTHVSNVLGTVNPAQEIIARAHEAEALVLLDAAQSVPHMPVDVQALDCDFIAFSGHKMCGPTGAGVLGGRSDLLGEMAPFLRGGGVIRSFECGRITWNDVPWKYEAGTAAVAEAVALGAAVDYLRAIGLERILEHERSLARYALDRMAGMTGVRVVGTAADERVGVITFTVDGIHPHDLAHMLDRRGVAIRAGFHCAQPLHERLGLDATARASFYLYNTRDEVDRLIEGIAEAQRWVEMVLDG